MLPVTIVKQRIATVTAPTTIPTTMITMSPAAVPAVALEVAFLLSPAVGEYDRAHPLPALISGKKTALCCFPSAPSCHHHRRRRHLPSGRFPSFFCEWCGRKAVSKENAFLRVKIVDFRGSVWSFVFSKVDKRMLQYLFLSYRKQKVNPSFSLLFEISIFFIAKKMYTLFS